MRKGKWGRGATRKIRVFGLLKHVGEVSLILPQCCDDEQLIRAIKANVELDSFVNIYSYPAYNMLSFKGFHH